MKIGVYNQPSVGAMNGVEFEASTLAEALAQVHDVDLVHHVEERTLDELRGFYGLDMKGVRLRYVKREPLRRSPLPWRRYRRARDWHRTCSEPYDVFVSFSASLPPFCHARHGVLRVIFPLKWEPGPRPTTLRQLVKRTYTDWEWRRRLRTYDVKLSNSAFTAKWAKRRRGIECTPVPPPARVRYPDVEKEPLILSVGRFAPGGGTPKCQLEMVQVFREMKREGMSGWRYRMVGPVGHNPESREYFDRVREIGEECDASALDGPDREVLDDLYARAAIFWHAAGLTLDEEKEPDNMEHFGIVTVEAMAAGCVPVVVNKGGQPEIVEHGENGFLWNTLAELEQYTRLLVNDRELRVRMSAAARESSRRYGPERFAADVLEECVAARILTPSDLPERVRSTMQAA